MIIPSLQHSNMHMCILSSTHTQIIQLQIPCACRYVFYFHIIINLYFFNLNNLFLTILSLCCCMGFYQVAVSRGHSLVAAASLVAEIELQGGAGFSSCKVCSSEVVVLGARAQAQQLWCTGLVALWHVGSSQTQGSSLYLPLYWQADSLPPSHQGSLMFLSICLQT